MDYEKTSFFLSFCFLITVVTANFLSAPGSSYQRQPVYFIEDSHSVVFFTFNVLWEKEHLGEILEILDKYEVMAVFFLAGEWLKKYPQEAQSIIEHGHEIGNNTYSRSRLILLEEEKIEKEIIKFNTLSRELLGYHPSFFRPPYGEYNARIVRIAGKEDCITVLWSINSLMLSGMESELIIGRMEEQFHDGAVILFHTSSPNILNTLPEIIEILHWKGYTIGSPDLLLEQAEKQLIINRR
ncbi:MAG: polysaccharide deacetylase family protein [Bacillota bacterium]|nr:polysaccharide deacetylase family protein [Bacillota bacterium]